jgi:hypothetical protein
MANETQGLTQLEFEEEDFAVAERMAKRLGYTQTAYTSTSALWGLFCLPDNPASIGKHVFRNSNPNAFDSNCITCDGKDRDAVHNMPLNYRSGGCIIKTRELGFLWVQDQEDIGLNVAHRQKGGEG